MPASAFSHRLIYSAVPLLVLGGALLLTGCTGEAKTNPKVEPTVRPVKLHTVQPTGASPVREYPGTVDAAESATLTFERPGTLVDVPVKEGESVEKGELLARLDPQDARARLEAARASRDAAESAYERAKQLYAQDIVPLQQLEARRRAFEVATSKLERAQEALRDTRIVAPFSGEVARKHVEQNETVAPQQPVVSVQNRSRMEVVVDIPEEDQLRARLRSAPLFVSLARLPGRRFPADLKAITTSATPVTRTFEATLTFDPPSTVEVLPGMTARAIVRPVSEGDTTRSVPLAVPSHAVVSGRQDTAAVWVVDPATMTVSARPIETGTLRDTMITVQRGLQAGDRIATTGVHQLTEGQEVRALSQ